MEREIIENLFNAAAGRHQPLSTIIEFIQLHQIDVTTIRNSRNQTLLHVAAGNNRPNLASYLIDQKADVNAQDLEGLAPLHNAAAHCHFTICSKLIEAGATVDIVDWTKGWSPLHCAFARDIGKPIGDKNWKVIQLLLESKADPYLKSTSGRDCFARINNSEDRQEVRLLHFFELVKTGDDVLEVIERHTTSKMLNSRLISRGDITPLHRAAGYNHLEVARLFIQKGARVNATDSSGKIPLHNAAQFGHIDMMELLIDEGSDFNKQDHVGYSPLHIAAKSNPTFTVCKVLIDAGANIELKCNEGKLPYDLAKSDDVKEMLKPKDGIYGDTRLKVCACTSGEGIYIDVQPPAHEVQQELPPDDLMLDSRSEERLFATGHTIKKIIIDPSDWRYRKIKKRMLDTIVSHDGGSGGNFTSYEILKIESILHKTVWEKYRLMCRKLELEYGKGTRNEKLLFHGSLFINDIQTSGFDERYAYRNGMFGAGIYFAEHSSKSNQYTLGRVGQVCQKHKDKSCYICERKMIYAQVALGRSLMSIEQMPECAHAPPGYSSVTGSPEFNEDLKYPEYVIYNGDQAYPRFVITYKIKP